MRVGITNIVVRPFVVLMIIWHYCIDNRKLQRLYTLILKVTGAAGLIYLRLNGGYSSVASKNAYAVTRQSQRITPTTKSNRDLG